MRVILHYDGSFDGLLSAVFQVYARRLPPDQVHLTADANDTDLFGISESVAANAEHARRVCERLARQIGRRGMARLLYGFLIAAPEMPDTFLRLVGLMLACPERRDVLHDYGHIDVWQWAQWVKTVGHEKHRMEAFVRFEELSGSLYLARIAPQYDVLPLIVPHFRRRYPQQHWAIFDTGRAYGVASNEAGLHPISQLDTAALAAAYAPQEQDYQRLWRRYFRSSNIAARRNPRLWRRYFRSSNIAARRNPRLHRQQLPQRYWRYLTEKQPELPG